MTRAITYPQSYIKKCFNVWYLGGRPSFPGRVREIIPDYDGHKPSKIQIRRWMMDGAWDEWADEMDAKVEIQVSDALIDKKAQMLIKHQEDAKVLAEKALDYLKVDGFDSSSAAVNAYFKATEEQRKTAGFSDLLERLDKMTNNEVEREIIDRLNRAADNDQIIDTDVIVEELSSGVNDEETESQE